MSKTISVNSLEPDSTYLVRGKITFSRVSRQTTDDERAKANSQRKHPIDKNYTTVSICNAQILAKNPNDPTLAERYAAECLYQSSSPDNPGNNFTAMNKSHNLPRVAVVDPNSPNTYNEIALEGELAAGLDVTLVMRVFKGAGNNGVSLDRVLVNEPIRYYQGFDKTVAEKLSDFGITYNTMPKTQQTAQPQAQPQTQPAAPSAFATVGAPAAPVAGNPFTSYDAPANNDGGNTPPVFGPGTRQY